MAVTVAPTTLKFSDPQESMQPAVISGGTTPYTVGSSSSTVATAAVSGAVVMVTAVGAGSATITVTDAASATCTITVTVTFSTPSFKEALAGYLGAPPTAPSTIFSDFQINASNPAVEWNPTEVGGVWEEAREIAGDFWIATNASYSTGTWVAVAAGSNQYALKLGADGSVTRYICAAGTVPLVWTAFWAFDRLGNLSNAASTTSMTLATQIAMQAAPTWNAAGVVMTGIQLSITDTASATASLLESYKVNNTTVWSIRKDGTLLAGLIPSTFFTGPPLPITLGGTATISPQLRASAPMSITGTWPNMTISNLGVLGLCAGTGITLSPTNGVGTVTVTALAAPITIGVDQTWNRITTGITTLSLLTLSTHVMTLGTSPLTSWRVYVEAYNGWQSAGGGTVAFGICAASAGVNTAPLFFNNTTAAHSTNLCNPVSDVVVSSTANVISPVFYAADFPNGAAVNMTINFWQNSGTTPLSGWSRMYAIAK